MQPTTSQNLHVSLVTLLLNPMSPIGLKHQLHVHIYKHCIHTYVYARHIRNCVHTVLISWHGLTYEHIKFDHIFINEFEQGSNHMQITNS